MAADIRDLSNDCLMKILEELPLADQFHFANVCQRFRFIFGIKKKSIYSSVVMSLNQRIVHKVDNEYFFRAIGSTVGHIQCLGSNIKMLQKYAKYLTHLNVLHYCGDRDTVVDELMPLMEQIKSADSFLIGNCTITGDVKMKDLNNILNCTLLKCHFTTPDAFKTICSHLKQVVYMVINACTGLLTPGFRALVANSSHLKELVLNVVDNTGPPDVLVQLSELSVLCLHCNNGSTMQKILTAIVKNKRTKLRSLEVKTYLELVHITTIARIKQLEDLNFVGLGNIACQLNDEMLAKVATLPNLKRLAIEGQASISTRAIINLVERCSTLMTLNVSYCMAVTNDCIITIAEMVMPRVKVPEKPFELIAVHTNVDAEIYENIRYWEIDFMLFELTINPSIE